MSSWIITHYWISFLKKKSFVLHKTHSKRVQNRRNIFSFIHPSLKSCTANIIVVGALYSFLAQSQFSISVFFLSQQLQLQFNSVAAVTFQISKIQICAPAYSGYLEAILSIMTKTWNGKKKYPFDDVNFFWHLRKKKNVCTMAMALLLSGDLLDCDFWVFQRQYIHYSWKHT